MDHTKAKGETEWGRGREQAYGNTLYILLSFSTKTALKIKFLNWKKDAWEEKQINNYVMANQFT